MNRLLFVELMLEKYGGKMSIREMARAAGIPHSSFREIIIRLDSNGASSKTRPPDRSPGRSPDTSRNAAGRQNAVHQSVHQSVQAPSACTDSVHEAVQANGREAAPSQETLFDDRPPSRPSPSSSPSLGQEEKKKKKKRKAGPPHRDKDPAALDDLGLVYHHFDRIHFERTGKTAGGNWGKAGDHIKRAIERGFTVPELVASMGPYHDDDGPWVEGHPVDRWATEVDKYHARARTSAGAADANGLTDAERMEREKAIVEKRKRDDKATLVRHYEECGHSPEKVLEMTAASMAQFYGEPGGESAPA